MAAGWLTVGPVTTCDAAWEVYHIILEFNLGAPRRDSLKLDMLIELRDSLCIDRDGFGRDWLPRRSGKRAARKR